MTTLEQAARLALDVMQQVNPDLVCDAFSHNRRKDLHGDKDVCPIAVRWIAALADLSHALAQQAEPEWVGLTNKEIYDCWPRSNEPIAIARAIESAFKEKNTKHAETVVEPGDDDLPDRLLQIHRSAAAGAVAKWQREQAESAVRESQQRERLASRLAGRKKGPSADTEFGVPHLAEDMGEAEPVVWDPQCPLCGGSRPTAPAQQAEPVADADGNASY
jgi:hypothetical protein